MPPPPILDPSQLDETNLVADRAAIEQFNPHRHEFSLLDGILLFAPERQLVAGYADIRADGFWARGHIPGRPLFPGVLMIEAAAQLASYGYHRMIEVSARFMGFTAVDDVKFRGVVEPPCRLVLVAQASEIKRRRFISETQGFVGETMVYHGRITGMPV